MASERPASDKVDNSVGTPTPSTACNLPEKFAWKASAPLIAPVSDAKHEVIAVKDPTVVRYKDRWHVYATSLTASGVYGMQYTSFADWADAPKAKPYFMDETPGFDTYVAAPQLFYFTPQKKWYLVFQSGPPMYATSDDPSDPKSWTRPAPFYAVTPAGIEESGGWLDFWVICDSNYCHLFFSNDHGRWYKSKTPISSFPKGFGDPVIVMQDAEAGRLFEASNVYKVKGTNEYLALIEAFDSSSGWRRYFRSWVAESLEGPWRALQDSGESPFAGRRNISFDGVPWTIDASHGELVRDGYDETLTLDACDLQFLIQGFDPGADTKEYNKIPWRLGLLTLEKE